MSSNNKHSATIIPTAEELAKALGTKPEAPVSEVKPVIKSEAKADSGALETILKNLPQKVQDSIRKLPEANRLDIAKDYFAMAHPEGMAVEFKAKLEAELPGIIQKMAGEFMVNLTGKRIQVMFPDGDGSATAEMVDPKAGKAKGEGGTKAPVTPVTIKFLSGKVMPYTSVGGAAKAQGLLNTGYAFKVATDYFEKPRDAVTGEKVPVRFRITSNEPGVCVGIDEIAVS